MSPLRCRLVFAAEPTISPERLTPYHKERPLAAVAVPALDRDSVKALPPALRQLADHNPKGGSEGAEQLPARRKRKAVIRNAFMNDPDPPRRRSSSTPATKARGAAKMAELEEPEEPGEQEPPPHTQQTQMQFQTMSFPFPMANHRSPMEDADEDTQSEDDGEDYDIGRPPAPPAAVPKPKPKAKPKPKPKPKTQPKAAAKPRPKAKPAPATPKPARAPAPELLAAPKEEPDEAAEEPVAEQGFEPAFEPKPEPETAYEAPRAPSPPMDMDNIPTELRRLMDFNGRGSYEKPPIASRRAVRAPTVYSPDPPRDMLPSVSPIVPHPAILPVGSGIVSPSKRKDVSSTGTGSSGKRRKEEPPALPAGKGKGKRLPEADVREAARPAKALAKTSTGGLAGSAQRTAYSDKPLPKQEPAVEEGVVTLDGVAPSALSTSASAPVTAASTPAPEDVKRTRTSLRNTPLNQIDLPSLSKDADVASLPLALRRLMDFNGTGATEVVRATGVRQVRAPRVLSPTDEPVRHRRASQKGDDEPNLNPASPLKKRAPKQRKKKQAPGVGVTGVGADREEIFFGFEQPISEDPYIDGTWQQEHNEPDEPDDEPDEEPEVRKARLTEEARVREEEAAQRRLDAAAPYVQPVPADEGAPSHKIWICMAGTEHRRLKRNLGSQYAYKQLVPSPAFLRENGYKFTVHVQNQGEFICTLGDSHYVVSGQARGFSWSHVDPSTVERIEHSAKHHGSRQADGKPNTFDPWFHRSNDLINKLKSNLKECGFWYQPDETVREVVGDTPQCPEYAAARAAEGWRPEEIKPLYKPTVEQLDDPYWFTAMMQGPGKRTGSIQCKFPIGWLEDEAHNYGHVSWPDTARLWKLEVIRSKGHQDSDLTSVKMLRPESKGYALDSNLAKKRLVIQIPTSPDGLSDFIDKLPQINNASPLMYGPQVKITPLQMEELERMMPPWALPMSNVDGMAKIFGTQAAEGTTTPTGFGGRFGISGLHDEYNHTVSFFVYPLWLPKELR